MFAKRLIWCLGFGGLLIFFTAPSMGENVDPVLTVPFVDLDRYVGTWYDIGSYPQRFQKGCHCTRARYSKNEDGTIAVINSCNRDSAVGRYSVANASAVVQKAAVEDGSFSRLKVYFFLPWLRLFGGDYWIIGLDDDYRWAVVGEPSRKYLWILSRTPVLAEDDLERAKAVIRQNGLDLDKIEWTSHSGCTYPE